MSGYLLVQAGTRALGFPVSAVDEIVPVALVMPVPGAHAAVRGVMRVRDRLIPLVHLATLLEGGVPPDRLADSAVVVLLEERRVAVEVDSVEDLVREPPDQLPPGWNVPWAAGVSKMYAALIPIIDVAALAERLRAAEVTERS